MSIDLNSIWKSIEADSQDKERGLLLRRLHSIGTHVGIDLHKNQKVLALEITSSKQINLLNLPKWKGVTLELTELDAQREALLLRLIDENNHDIFNALIRDLDDSLHDITRLDGALVAFTECLERWRAFFDKFGSSNLSFEAQRGLYGELFFLKNYVFPRTDGLTALQYWRGHGRKHQDFSFPGGNVEIKTTIKKDHKSVIINSEKQLDDTGLNSLYLYCLAMNTIENGSNTLNIIIKDMVRHLARFPNSVRTFKKCLNQAGYLEDHYKYYEDMGYSIKREYFFKINEGFPRVILLPNGVGDIRYSIMLSTCSKYAADIDHTMRALLRRQSQ